MAAVYLVNGFFLLKVSFPDHKAQSQTRNDKQAVPDSTAIPLKTEVCSGRFGAVTSIKLHINCFIHVGSSLAPELRT